MRKRHDRSLNESLFSALIYIVVMLFALVCLFPFYLIVVNSIVDNKVLNQEGYQLYVKKFSSDSYKYLFEGSQAYTSYKVTLFVTAVGSLLATAITSMYAFVLSHRKVRYRHILAFFTYVPMVVGTGLVGFYLLVAQWLHLKDTIWALIFPYLLNPFLVFVLVNFFRALPYELYESASIDGANDIYVFFRIILPISIPGVATVILFYALTYWNDWWLAILFINHDYLHPLQMMIRSLMSQINATQYVMGRSMYIQNVPSEGLKLATVCITIGPIVLLYPLIQRYFVKGLTLGAVKG
ncbi:MAG: carbohydrate ABC transporter permease [Spirochaetia bacterium]|jgi:multiple sugar transport system permease protein/putative aldouronate transport system permease protein